MNYEREPREYAEKSGITSLRVCGARDKQEAEDLLRLFADNSLKSRKQLEIILFNKINA